MTKSKSFVHSIPPVVIGGNGHSGTRLPVTLLRQGGVNFGSVHFARRANSEDCRNIWLLDRWCSRYISSDLSDNDNRQMKREFLGWLRILFPRRTRAWGFKNPRTIMLLPFLDSILTGMKFIHVVRDGRDIAFNNIFGRQNNYVNYYLEDNENNLPGAEQMALFWARLNCQAFKYGSEEMKGRYLIIRLEDLCSNPIPTIQEIYNFVGVKPKSMKKLVGIIRTPSSLGRWQLEPQTDIDRVSMLIHRQLRLFGYL